MTASRHVFMKEWEPLPKWFDKANCAGVDPDLFFPERGDTATVKEAKAVCSGCVVRLRCLNYAIVNGETHGIWGGTSERQRRRLRVARIKGMVA
jgi:WhiB family redox-sensing transcriptional regulator